MKSSAQLIVLLACISLCTSQKSIAKCRCIKTIAAIRFALIADVNVYEPSAICNKRQVIVVRKDNREFCLNPESNFTKRLIEMNKTKLSTTTKTTTAATTQSAAKATSSVTNQ